MLIPHSSFAHNARQPSIVSISSWLLRAFDSSGSFVQTMPVAASMSWQEMSTTALKYLYRFAVSTHCMAAHRPSHVKGPSLPPGCGAVFRTLASALL